MEQFTEYKVTEISLDIKEISQGLFLSVRSWWSLSLNPCCPCEVYKVLRRRGRCIWLVKNCDLKALFLYESSHFWLVVGANVSANMNTGPWINTWCECHISVPSGLLGAFAQVVWSFCVFVYLFIVYCCSIVCNSD